MGYAEDEASEIAQHTTARRADWEAALAEAKAAKRAVWIETRKAAALAQWQAANRAAAGMSLASAWTGYNAPRIDAGA